MTSQYTVKFDIFPSPVDLLGIRPAPNNGTHGSLNHLLSRPFHLPVHPAQLSYDTQCEAGDPVPADDLQCACDLHNDSEVRVDKVIEVRTARVRLG